MNNSNENIQPTKIYFLFQFKNNTLHQHVETQSVDNEEFINNQSIDTQPVDTQTIDNEEFINNQPVDTQPIDNEEFINTQINNILNVIYSFENFYKNNIQTNNQTNNQTTNDNFLQNLQVEIQIDFDDDNSEEYEFDENKFKNCKEINEIIGKPKQIHKDDILLQQECSICLTNYKIKEYKRILPKCNHCFHKKCIDKWLKKKSFCPICKNNLLE